jgi:hypothetical protein
MHRDCCRNRKGNSNKADLFAALDVEAQEEQEA